MNWEEWKRLLIRKQRLSKACALLLMAAAIGLAGAQTGGFVAGVVRARSGVAVRDAEVAVQSELTGARQKMYCDELGRYASTELAPGTYRIAVRSPGFRTVTQAGVIVEAAQTRSADFVIDLLPLQQEVTVNTTRDQADPAGNGLEVSRESAASTLPQNGRDLHALYALMPGATVTPASTGDGGQFSVTGQRPNTNTFRVDGVSGNTGLGIAAVPGAFTGSSLPAMTVIGSTQDMASKEDIERVELRSSEFAPEFGDRPGAQIEIETRSGSNDFHGGAFGYRRPGLLDSQDWFAKKYDAPLAAASLNGYGGSLGGALWRNRTFFFAAYERVNVNDTALQLMAVPSLSARQSAPVNYHPLLNAFPLPSGTALNDDESLATVGLEKQAEVQNYSGRIDQVIGDKIRIFARYANVPSSSLTEQVDVRNARFQWMSATVGLTSQWGKVTHDIRFNFSRVVNTSSWSAANQREQTAFDQISVQTPVQAISTPGSAMLTSGSGLFESFYPLSSVESLSIAGNAELVSGVGERSSQSQWEETYTFARQWGGHNIRWGEDCIRLLPRTDATGVFTTAVAAEGIGELLAGEPLGVTVSGGRGLDYYDQIYVGSTFFQDSYKVNERLSLLYGLRWEITPKASKPYAPEFPYVGTINNGGEFNAVGFLGDGSFTLPSSFTQLAPRFGLAYRFKSPDLVFRAGGGIFYDTALASLVDPVNASPFNGWQFVPGLPDFTPALLPNAPKYYSSQLSLPKVWEWRTALEKSVGEGSLLSLAYVGSAGSKLLREEAGTYSTGLLQAIDFESNGTSNYQALQTQYSGHITPRLYTLMSYTWGHSIDTGSDESSVFLAEPGNSTSLDRGSSDFDVRHNANFSLSYALPSAGSTGLRRAWLGGWNLSSTMEARSGFPFDVTTVDRSVGLGFADSGRPDAVPGVPMWIADKAVPEGRELNPAAFAPAPYGTTGALGRNVLTGSGLFQMDASLRRQFRLYRASSVEVSVSAFNLLNHANFSNPEGYLGSPLFGQPTSMQNLMLGSGSPTSGITPIFQAGGPRTVELHLKFTF